MGLGELPAVRQLLPLVGPQVLGSQLPQHWAERLCFPLMVLLNGQTLPRRVTEVPAQEAVPWGRSQQYSSHLGEIPARLPCSMNLGPELASSQTWGLVSITLVFYSMPGFESWNLSCLHIFPSRIPFLTFLSLNPIAIVKRPPVCHLFQEAFPIFPFICVLVAGVSVEHLSNCG